jgi:hypothetical protein
MGKVVSSGLVSSAYGVVLHVPFYMLVAYNH